MLNVAMDRRHDRRALSDEEVNRLLTAAKSGKVRFKMSGVDRHMLYLVALSTGLRASELASLKPESLQLLDEPPTVTVRAGYSKRRRLDVLPMPSAVITDISRWLAQKPAGSLLWPGRWADLRHGG